MTVWPRKISLERVVQYFELTMVILVRVTELDSLSLSEHVGRVIFNI